MKEKGEFESKIVDRYSSLTPVYRPDVMSYLLGALIAHFDEKKRESINKEDLERILLRGIENAEDGYAYRLKVRKENQVLALRKE